MSDAENALFAAVDALVEQAAAPGELPPPAERRRLREAAGLTRQQVAGALDVSWQAVAAWESGRAVPRPPKRAAYARLLERLAERLPQPGAQGGASRPADGAAGDGKRTGGATGAREEEPTAGVGAGPGPRGMAVGGGAPGAATDRARGVVVDGPDADGPDAPGTAAAPVPRTERKGAAARPSGAPAPGRRPATGGSDRRGTPAADRTGTAAGAVDVPGPARPGDDAAALPAAGPAGAPYPAGPLVVLDGAARAHTADGRTLHCPAATVTDLVEWALGAGIGQERLHRHGRDADPLVVLTEAAAERLGLPARLTDRRNLRLPEDHPAVRDLLAAGWRLTRRGFGPWARVHQPVEAHGTRRCVQLAVLPWDALDTRAWSDLTAFATPGELARALGTYATRVLTPRGSTAVNGLELMTALRPPTRPVRDATGGWTSGHVAGSLAVAVDPAPPEAPDEHPVAAGRDPHDVLDEEAYEWVRDPDLLSDAECALPHAVGLDVNMAFAAAANRLRVGLGAPLHTDGPRFDPKLPGAWYADLSGIATDPRLPSPFTPTGQRPTGPAWYATPTLAYAAELGHPVRPLEAWLRPEAGPYLDPWYTRLRDAYLATMADLGVTKDLTDADFLAAMERHRAADPATAGVLSAIKATVKGGIGKLRERPQGAGHRPGGRWPALERPTWRPDIRAAVIAQARTNMHRKMARMAAHGHFPLAVLSDCVVYPAPGPSPLDLLPRTGDGAPAPGVFRLGVSPGMVKLEGARELWWAAELMEQGHNPARHIKE
ncbi:telomere-associated protein Tap [Streptomyces xiamenensis]|uniref:telomere-associated protein Tap n=1 Tax=Streptomyces xiamenensis TaxID=408015 RepID=UPI0037D81C10